MSSASSASSAPAAGDPYAALAQLQQQHAAMQQQLQQQAVQQQQQFAHMQQAAMVQAAAAAAGAHPAAAPSRLPKIGLPLKFKGSMGSAVDTWHSSMVQQFVYYNIADESSKLRMGAGNLEGDALQWFNSIPAANAPTTWNDFMELLYKRFRPVAAILIARQNLAKLRQGQHSVSAYAHRVQTLLTAIPDMGPSDQVFQFAYGLSPTLAAYVWEHKPTTLIDAIQLAASKEALLGFVGRPGGPSHHRQGAGPSSSDSVPMDLNHVDFSKEEDDSAPRFHDEPASAPRVESLLLAKLEAMEQRLTALSSKPPSSNPSNKSGDRVPGLKSGEIDRLMKEGRCFRCKQKGHMKRDCLGQKQGN